MRELCIATVLSVFAFPAVAAPLPYAKMEEVAVRHALDAARKLKGYTIHDKACVEATLIVITRMVVSIAADKCDENFVTWIGGKERAQLRLKEAVEWQKRLCDGPRGGTSKELARQVYERGPTVDDAATRQALRDSGLEKELVERGGGVPLNGMVALHLAGLVTAWARDGLAAGGVWAARVGLVLASPNMILLVDPAKLDPHQHVEHGPEKL